MGNGLEGHIGDFRGGMPDPKRAGQNELTNWKNDEVSSSTSRRGTEMTRVASSKSARKTGHKVRKSFRGVEQRVVGRFNDESGKDSRARTSEEGPLPPSPFSRLVPLHREASGTKHSNGGGPSASRGC